MSINKFQYDDEEDYWLEYDMMEYERRNSSPPRHKRKTTMNDIDFSKKSNIIGMIILICVIITCFAGCVAFTSC